MKKFIKYLDHYKPETKEDYVFISQVITQNYKDFKIGPVSTSYDEWQKQHEVFTTKKIPYNIDASIENLDDLIHIIDNNPMNPEYEYNINLQALHDIRPELVSLQSMIGLKSLKQSIVDQLLYLIQNLHTGSESDFKHTVLLDHLERVKQK